MDGLSKAKNNSKALKHNNVKYSMNIFSLEILIPQILTDVNRIPVNSFEKNLIPQNEIIVNRFSEKIYLPADAQKGYNVNRILKKSFDKLSGDYG